MGKQKTYSWEFKLQMVHVLAKGTHTISQISRDYHVTRSLLYAWIRMYQSEEKLLLFPTEQLLPYQRSSDHTMPRSKSRISNGSVDNRRRNSMYCARRWICSKKLGISSHPYRDTL